MQRLNLAIVLTVALAACSNPAGPLLDGNTVASNGLAPEFSPPGLTQLSVMTRNVFVGADVDRVIAAGSPEEIPVLVAQTYAELFATDFNERAKALAREIAQKNPQLVGLQEISTIRLQSPGDAAFGGTTPAETVVFDFLAILMRELDATRAQYRVASLVQNADVEMPMIVDPATFSFDDVRLTDYDVVLVRSDVEVLSTQSANYAAALEVPVGPGVTFQIPRGYTSVVARIDGTDYRFVNTHLEPASIPELLPLQMAQAAELVETFAGETVPVIVVGDLNTPAPTGETYGLMTAAGYEDGWAMGPGHDPGFTCCYATTLDSPRGTFDRRFDLVLVRNLPDVAVTRAEVVGSLPYSLTSLGLWPSDHGGVFVALRGRPVH